MAVRLRYTFLSGCLCLVLCGCQGMTYSVRDGWRLESVEEKTVQLQEDQLQQRDRLDALEKRLAVLEASQLADSRVQKGKAAPRLAASSQMKTPPPERKSLRPQKKKTRTPYVCPLRKHPRRKPAPAKVAAAPSKKAPASRQAPCVPPAHNVQPQKASKAVVHKQSSQAHPVKKVSRVNVQATKAKDLYDRGLRAVLEDRPAKGRELLNHFIKKYPRHELQPNARYWIGESFYSEKRFPESILAFKAVTRGYPKHEKSAAALLKTGYAYEKLGDARNAAFYLKIVVQDYPNTEPARLARRRLALRNW